MAKLNKNGIRKTARMAKDSYEINFWIDDKHIYETIKATSVSDAVAIRAKRIQEIKSGEYIKRTDINVIEFYSIFRENYLVPNSSAITLNDYDVKFKRYAVTRIGNKKIQNIKSKDIYDFYSNIRNTTNAKEGTLKIVHAYLRKMFNFAVDLEYINRSPMAKVTAPKSVGKKFVVWSPEEVNKFLDYSKEKNIWSYYVMAFTVMTGLRRSEVCGLKWEDINWDKKTIQLTRTVHDIVGQEYPVIQHGKTKGSMTTIPVPELAMDLLKDIKGFHLTVESKVDKTLFPNNEGWVFLNSYGKLINTGWITNSFRRNLQKLDLPTPMNLRGFRHLFATYLLQQNVHPKVVQELLRHSTFKLTMDTYSHVVESIGREAVSSIDQVLNMGKAK